MARTPHGEGVGDVTTWGGDFEEGLVDAIEPIRQFAVATTLLHFHESGLYDSLVAAGPATARELADSLDFDHDRVLTMLRFLTVEGFVDEVDGNRFTSTQASTKLLPFLPWYRLLIGGYGESFLQMGDKLRGGSDGTTRDLAMVGSGSCGISRYDSIPLTRALLEDLDEMPRRVADLGCGNGLYITELCKALPEISAFGVEPSVENADQANRRIAKLGYAQRAHVVCGDASIVRDDAFDFNPDCVLIGFVLHEILEQSGRDGLAEFLKSIAERYPNLSVVVIEVDNRHDETKFMQDGLARSYYNAYYLLHPFTTQRLEKRDFWLELFAECGYEVISEKTTSPDVDSTGLELGFLLNPASTAQC